MPSLPYLIQRVILKPPKITSILVPYGSIDPKDIPLMPVYVSILSHVLVSNFGSVSDLPIRNHFNPLPKKAK